MGIRITPNGPAELICRTIQASPLSYQVNGVQYVAVVATNIEVLRLP
jgi:hypothetical protein